MRTFHVRRLFTLEYSNQDLRASVKLVWKRSRKSVTAVTAPITLVMLLYVSRAPSH